MEKRTIVVIILLLIAGSFFLKNLNIDPEYTAEIERRTAQEKAIKENAVMTFEVDVPSNTFDDDTVWIFLHNQKAYKMNKTGDYTYRHDVSIHDLDELNEGGSVKYRYSRNGYNFRTAEYLEPDTNDYFWTEKGRQTKFENGKVQRDVVERWRWFPKEGLPVRTSPIEPEGDFLPRIDGMEFRSGQIIEDLYESEFDDFFDSTAEHMKETGYKWVELDPPEQMTLVDGMPKVVNKRGEAPNYPNEEKLKEEILAYKNQGFKVALAPQMCCEIIDHRNRSDEWWDAYFSETEKFVIRMADVAEETDVDAFHFFVGTDYQGPDAAERWEKIFQEINNHFSGEVGQGFWSHAGNPRPPEPEFTIFPEPEFVAWADELDYFYVAIDHPISLEESPTDEELEEGAGRMLDGTKVLYDTLGKPIMIRTTYFNVEQTWKGSYFYDIGSVPWISEPEQALEDSVYNYGPGDQARVVNAYFKAIAERPWVVSYAQFGYTHWENPLSAELSTRGKPSEDVWRKWNGKIYSAS